MKLGLIGANGRVGAELCFLLKDQFNLIPITRNRLGSVFLKHHGFDCIISDVSIEKDAMNSLSDLDVVVISSYATDPFSGSQTRSSQKINENLIRNSIKFSKQNAIIIYFSTIRAFSNKIDPNASRYWTKPGYDKEKLHLENFLISESKKSKKMCFALRIGHVFGENQPRTRKFREILSKPKITIRVNPKRESNIIHTVTIRDAIINCLESKSKPGIYSLVNSPQWTWEDVFNFYKKSETIVEYKSISYEKQQNNSFIWNLLKANKKYLAPLRYYTSPKYDTGINKKLAVKRMMASISNLKHEEAFYTGEFDYLPIPGPYLKDLPETKDALKNYNLPEFT